PYVSMRRLTPRATLIPYTTLFRSDLKKQADENVVAAEAARKAAADRKAEVEQLIADQQAKKATIEERKAAAQEQIEQNARDQAADRKSTRLNSSHVKISYAVYCLK